MVVINHHFSSYVRCAVKMAAVFCHVLLLSLLLVLCLLVVDSVCCCCWLYKWFSKVYYVVVFMCMSCGYLMSSLDSCHFVFRIMLCILLVCLVRVFAYVLHIHTHTHTHEHTRRLLYPSHFAARDNQDNCVIPRHHLHYRLLKHR